MAYLKESIYKGSLTSFPNEFIPEDKKDKSWFTLLAQAIMSDYCSDNTSVPYSKRDEFEQLRRYGNGTQDEAEAMKLVFSNYGKKDAPEDAEANRKGMHNIDSSILPIMVKFKQTILGLFEDIDFQTFANATDRYSTNEKEQQKWQMYADTLLEDIVNEVNQATNRIQAPDNKWKPKDLNDMKLFESLGGIRVAAEIAIEKLATVLEDDSRLYELKEKFIEDGIDVGYMASQTHTDRYTQKVSVKYRMPEYCIAKYQREDEFDSQKYAGYISSMAIEELRKSGEFKDEELADLAESYYDINKQTFGGMDSFGKYNDYDETKQHWGFDKFRVDVLEGWFLGSRAEYRKKVVSNNDRVISDKPTYWMDNSKGTYRYDSPVLYRFKWVIGTDYIFDYGYEYDVSYKNNVPMIPLQIVKLRGPSITSRCRPNLVNMQVAWVKFQNALTKSRPPGLAVNYDSVASMGIKDKKMKGTDILRITLNEGNIIYRGTTKNGTPIPGANKPIYELEGGMGKQLDEFIRVFETNRLFIQEVSGITPEASGGGGVPERQSSKLSDIMYNNTNNNLKPIITKYHHLKLRFTENGIMKIRDAIHFSEKAKEYYSSAIGKTFIEGLYLPDSKSFRDIAISLKLKADAKIKERILNAATISMQSSKEGAPGITHADYILVEQIVEHGNLKEAQLRLDIAISDREEKAQKRREEMQKSSEENAIKLKQEEAKKEQAKQAEETKRLQMKLNAESELKLALADKEIEKAKIIAGIKATQDNNKSINAVA
ncbi:MAG: hypothetical protein ACI9DM_000250 [Cyclobacteriaceae bacterium]|jgi:hypothetical protein